VNPITENPSERRRKQQQNAKITKIIELKGYYMSYLAERSCMPTKLMDCTLRDGSYAVDFQFTAKFTGELSRALDMLGFEYIEVGHGIGIGATDRVRRAIATDHEYAKAAETAVTNSKWGMFAIPNIASLDEVDAMFDQGMDFVRVGIDALELESGIGFLEKVIKPGREVFVNFMKSYALSTGELGKRVKMASEVGVDGIYLVDSAGGILPNDLEVLSEVLFENRGDAQLGFHGHDNLGLALANSLQLALQGFDIIDCTLQGLGRSSGNAGTEKLVALLNRTKLNEEFTVSDVLKVGEDLVRPKIPLAGHSGLDTFAGYTLFHTSYMDNLISVSRDLGVDPYVLMQEHCKKNLVSASIAELQDLAKVLKESGQTIDVPLPADRYIGLDQ
jgi:4-hydroxy 2-oxovalerate aldolase